MQRPPPEGWTEVDVGLVLHVDGVLDASLISLLRVRLTAAVESFRITDAGYGPGEIKAAYKREIDEKESR